LDLRIVFKIELQKLLKGNKDVLYERWQATFFYARNVCGKLQLIVITKRLFFLLMSRIGERTSE